MLKKHCRIALFTILLITTGFFDYTSSVAFAIVIIPRPPVRIIKPVQQLQLGDASVTATIKDDIVKTKMFQSFYNPNDTRLEADVYIPIPNGAGITNFSVTIDGKMQKGEVLESGKARKLYEDIVRNMRDPGLLEFTEQGLAHIRLFPVEPKKSMSFECEFIQKIDTDQGTRRMVIPLKISDKMFRERKNGISIEVTLIPGEDDLYRNIYSPTHKLDIKQPQEKGKPVTVTVKRDGEKNESNSDFILYYDKSNKDFAMTLLSEFDNDSTQGTFMMVLDPPVEENNKAIEPEAQDVVFVIDTSGSMSGDKIEQTKKAIKQCINMLREKDKFALVQFASSVNGWNDYTLADGTKEKKAKACGWVDDLTATGGTNISGALEKALTLRGITKNEQRLLTVIFLTDGQPTVGAQEPEEILREVAKNNKGSLRVFTFGVGYDVNTTLLDSIAEDTRAAVEYIKPKEDMEVPVSRLFEKVSRPALTNLTLKIDNVGITEMYPPNLPDLLYGTQLTVLGRYDKNATATVTLCGTRQEKLETHTFEKAFAPKSDLDKSAFLEKLWATRKAGWLTQQVRKGNSSQELKDELIALGNKYNIATPYTSMLVMEDTDAAPQASRHNTITPSGVFGRQSAGRRVFKSLSNSYAGEAAVAMSMQQKAMQSVEQVSNDSRQISPEEYRVDETTRLILTDTGLWLDTALEEKQPADIVLKYLSEAWFDATGINPKLKTAFAAGDKLRMKLKNGTIVEVSPDKGTEQLNDEDKAKLDAK